MFRASSVSALEITPWVPWEIIWDAEDGMQVGQVEGKNSTCYTIASAPSCHFFKLNCRSHLKMKNKKYFCSESQTLSVFILHFEHKAPLHKAGRFVTALPQLVLTREEMNHRNKLALFQFIKTFYYGLYYSWSNAGRLFFCL